MKIRTFGKALILTIIINLWGYRMLAQCDEIASNYQRYLISHSLNLDPIEGMWKAYRTVRVYKGNYLKRTKKEEFTETWGYFKTR